MHPVYWNWRSLIIPPTVALGANPSALCFRYRLLTAPRWSSAFFAIIRMECRAAPVATWLVGSEPCSTGLLCLVGRVLSPILLLSNRRGFAPTGTTGAAIGVRFGRKTVQELLQVGEPDFHRAVVRT